MTTIVPNIYTYKIPNKEFELTNMNDMWDCKTKIQEIAVPFHSGCKKTVNYCQFLLHSKLESKGRNIIHWEKEFMSFLSSASKEKLTCSFRVYHRYPTCIIAQNTCSISFLLERIIEFWIPYE